MKAKLIIALVVIGGEIFVEETGESGTFMFENLPRGRYGIAVEAGELVLARRERAEVEAPDTSCDLTVTQGRKLTGYCVTEEREPVGNVRLTAFVSEAEYKGGGWRMLPPKLCEKSPDGVFQIVGVQPGRSYMVRALAPGVGL